MTSQRILPNLYSTFWSLYGRYAWDDQRESSKASDPPAHIVKMVQSRSSRSKEWILDAGCGTGSYAIALAQAGFQVIGADFASGMLAKAKTKITPELSESVSFRQADMNRPLDFAESRFHHIISISVLQAVANPLFTLGELRRLLKPNGTLILSLPKKKTQHQSIGDMIQFRVRHLERPSLGKVMLVMLKSFADRYSHRPCWTVLQAEQLVSNCGFGVIFIDEGKQILVVAEKIAAPPGVQPTRPVAQVRRQF
jgi:ubiquinone/menaquinone biosynthesis C-methylase UbiE